MTFWESLWEGLLDAIVDTATLVPFLFATYVAMEVLEHAGKGYSERVVTKAGAAGPLVGALLGVLPQCGFSAMAATLYAVRLVGLGTLLAVMLSTSDEMLPVFIASGAPATMIGSILLFKIVVAIVVGFLVDMAVRVWIGPAQEPRIHELCLREGCLCDELPEEDACCEKDDRARYGETSRSANNCGAARQARTSSDALNRTVSSDALIHSGAGAHAFGHGHHSGRAGFFHILKAALAHTVQVSVFILVITFALDFALDFVGDDVIATYLVNHPSQAVVASGIVGLIPNCAASVIISELFLEGAIGSGALISGLLVGSGVSILVLFRADRRPKNDLGICAILLGVGVLCGFALNLSGFTFG